MKQFRFLFSVLETSLATAYLLGTLVHPTSAAIIPVRSAAEIRTAMSSAQPGDTLLMQEGTWVNQHISFVGNGTELDPIVLRAETVGSVVLTGTSTLRISGEWLVVDGLVFNEGYTFSSPVIEFRATSMSPARHCRLTNTVIRNYNPSEISTGYKWVSLYGQYNRVDHCYFTGKTNSGALLVVWMDEEPDYHRIDHNRFAERPPLGANGAEIIRIGTSDWSMYDSNCVVEDNLFQQCNGEIEIISNKSCENIYRRNTFRACSGTLTLRHGNRCSVYQNFFLGDNEPNSGGVRIIGEDHRVYNNYFENLEGQNYYSAISLVNAVPDSPLNRYFQVKRALVANNTVVNCAHSLTIGAGADEEEKTLPPLDCIIANNVVYHEDPCQFLIEYKSEPNNLFYLGNIMYGVGLEVNEPKSGILWQDPCLIPTDSLWRPAATSPLLDAVQSVFAFITEDRDGHLRCGLIEQSVFDAITEDMNDFHCGLFDQSVFNFTTEDTNDFCCGLLFGQSVFDVIAEDMNGFLRCGLFTQSILDFIAEDVDGHIRSGLFDVGADEWLDEPITNVPLTPDDVGPEITAPRGR